VYVNHGIILSKTKAEHIKDINWVFKCLYEGDMRVSQEKSKFFKKSVDYLGLIESFAGLTTSPDKIISIKAFQPPKSLYSLRSFLGL